MTINQILKQSISQIPQTEAEILLSFVLKKDKTFLYKNPNYVLSSNLYSLFTKLVKRRIAGESIAYITHNKEFFGLDFYVNGSVLIPRPETEILVEEVLSEITKRYTLNPKRLSLVDIGTGSGCVAIAIAYHFTKVAKGILFGRVRSPLGHGVELSAGSETRAGESKRPAHAGGGDALWKKHIPEPELLRIYATDISKKALKVAQENAKIHNVENKIKFLSGDLLSPLPEKVDIIVANLPYVKNNAKISKYEPKISLYSGKDGVDHIKKLLTQATRYLNKNGMIFLEISPEQKLKLSKIIPKIFPNAQLEFKKDLANLNRVLIIKNGAVG